nr:hypothetical protein [Pandoravirus aubagnensis]
MLVWPQRAQNNSARVARSFFAPFLTNKQCLSFLYVCVRAVGSFSVFGGLRKDGPTVPSLFFFGWRHSRPLFFAVIFPTACFPFFPHCVIGKNAKGKKHTDS